ncbi:1534_t:CDS:2, partial [Funneliformis geosporum]
ITDLMLPILDIDMLHESQEYNSSHDTPACKEVVSTEGENDDLDYEDSTNELYVTPSNFETTVSDPYISTFIDELLQDENDGFVASFQKICYFNGADAYAVPHRGNHIQPASQNIAHIVEWWLTEKLSHTGETIPILEESPQTSAESIIFKIREVASALNGMAKVLINIRAGHVYSLHMIGDEIVMAPNYERFFQQFPLFVNVSIKVQEHLPSARHNTCQVLVAVEHVTMKDQTVVENRIPCKFSQHYHQSFDESFTTTRTTSSPDGQTFCLLEEVATN